MSRKVFVILVFCLVRNSVLAQTAPQQDAGGVVVISQIYGGGGNSGAVWSNDFVELFNRGDQVVVIDGWSVQYASATRTTWQKVELEGRLEPGARYLIQLAGGSNGAGLPSADATGSINLSATAGKVALVRDAGLLGADCHARVVDLVGYGNSASCFEGAGPAPGTSSTKAIFRAADGCLDSNDNASDFSTEAPAPRNSSTTKLSCGGEVEPGTGLPLPAGSALSGLKAGSILIYPLYASNPAGHVSWNTRISLTNTDPGISVTTHLYFFNGGSGAVIDGFLCLTAGQTATFLASDLDPGVTGYLVAVAVDALSGCPVRANALIGDATVRLGSGRTAALPAHAVAAISDPPVDCGSSAVEIAFDGVNYNQLPGELALNNFRTDVDGQEALLVLLRQDSIIGRLSGFILSGFIMDDAENRFEFETPVESGHILARLPDFFPALNMSSIVPAGRSGWMKFKCQDGGALIGAVIGQSEGRNLHILGLANDTRWVMPVIPGGC